MKRIGILTGGGDAPGLNAVIRAAAKVVFRGGGELIGFIDGYSGLVENNYRVLDKRAISGLLHRGGTILGTNNRDNPFNYPVRQNGKTVYKDMSDMAIKNLNDLKIETLIAIGGDGSLAIARELGEKGTKVIGVPKTIDNDLMGTEQTFGFDTAVTTATEALDRLHTTAESHHRVMVLELMGRYAGWIALYSGLAGGADVILIPEIPWKLEQVVKKINQRKKEGKPFSIIVVAEGVKTPEGDLVIKQRIDDSGDPLRLGGIGQKVAEMVEASTGFETRVTVLGHLQRGGSPSPFDRILATRYGVYAAEMALKGEHGIMVSLINGKIQKTPLSSLTSTTRNVPVDSEVIYTARQTGISFGD